MHLYRWFRRSTKSGRIPPHLLLPVPRDRAASIYGKVALHLRHHVNVPFINEEMPVSFHDIDFMSVAGDGGFRPAPGGVGCNTDDWRSAVGGIVKTPIDLNGLLHGGPAPQFEFACGLGTINATMPRGKIAVSGRRVNFWSAYRVTETEAAMKNPGCHLNILAKALRWQDRESMEQKRGLRPRVRCLGSPAAARQSCGPSRSPR
jgi:hypothetical protein